MMSTPKQALNPLLLSRRLGSIVNVMDNLNTCPPANLPYFCLVSVIQGRVRSHFMQAAEPANQSDRPSAGEGRV